MRGSDQGNGSLFSYVDLEQRVRPDHPLRVIREIANASLKALSADFDALYSPFGRESIPPERLVRAFLPQALFSIPSERQLVERIEYDPLFRLVGGPRPRENRKWVSCGCGGGRGRGPGRAVGGARADGAARGAPGVDPARRRQEPRSQSLREGPARGGGHAPRCKERH